MKQKKITEKIKQQIVDQISPDFVVSDPESLEKYSCDASELRYTPEMVVKAKCREDVQTIIRLANKYSFPVTPRGGGSGLAGAALPDRGGVVLSLEDMNHILSLDTKNLIMEVEPGAISKDVRDAAAKAGFFIHLILLEWS